MNSSRTWLDRLAGVECLDSTFHAMSSPLVLSRADGPWLWDVEGKRYLDLCAGFGVMALGHNSSVVRRILQRYLEEVPPPVIHGMGDVYPADTKVALLEAVRGFLPSRLTRGALALSGGQAIEIAVKTAVQATGHTGFIAFEDGYHGLDLGILPLTGRKDFRAPFVRDGGSVVVVRLPYGSTDEATFMTAAAELRRSGAGFAGVVVEPIQGRGGMIEPPAGWLSSLAEWAHCAQGLLILDEIFTGLGRSGRMTFADAVDADLICLGKALGGGFPVSACFGTEAAMRAWPESMGEAIHTGTFFGHPLTCAVATGVVQAIIDEGLAQRAAVVGAQVKSQLSATFRGEPGFAGVTGSGMMLAVHFSEGGAGARLMDSARQMGIVALASGARGQCLSFTPSLTIDSQLWLDAVQRLTGRTVSPV